MPNPVIFVDFPSPDPEATSQFYADLFEWEFKRRPAGVFHEVLPGIKPNLGIHVETKPVTGPVPRVYGDERGDLTGRQPWPTHQAATFRRQCRGHWDGRRRALRCA